MEDKIDQWRHAAPSLLLVGMRGAGKTTLGRLAAEHLDTDFIDADEIFTNRFTTPKDFVAQHGWPAFRSAETRILREVLTSLQSSSREKPLVVSLGGGVVETEDNRTMLQRCWSTEQRPGRLDRSQKIAVVHIFREIDKVLLDRRGLPSWGIKDGGEVWQRRRPWFRECSSHEFTNLSEILAADSQGPEAETSRAARLRFEAVERDFLRFLSQLFASYSLRSVPYLPPRNKRSFLVTLPFADLRPNTDHLQLITMGADAIELRADLLHDTARDPSLTPDNTFRTVEAYENPSLSFISEQFALVCRHLPGYPVVFTLRTPAQGGRYPYPADAPAEALFASLHHALKLGCDVIDIEVGLDVQMTQDLVREAKERNVSVLISWRDTLPPSHGGFKWKSERAQQLYDEAVVLGADIVKIVGTAGQVADNFELRVFASSLEDFDTTGRSAPLSAYNMGSAGRISRFLNPVLASVTHSIAKELSKRGVVGNPSMTFEEIQKALHLSGLLEKATFICVQDNGTEQIDRDESIQRHQRWSQLLGLPFTTRSSAWPQHGLPELLQANDPRQGDIRGYYYTRGLPSLRLDSSFPFSRGIEVEQTEYYDTVIINGAASAGSSINLMLKNSLVGALVDLVKNAISPSVHLGRGSLGIIVTSGDQEERRYLKNSAHTAASSLGLARVEVIHTNERASVHSGMQPSVIFDCNFGTALPSSLLENLLANPNGGLYLSLCCREEASIQSFMQQGSVRQAGWRHIPASSIWRHVDAIRFRTFTDRRAPPLVADEQSPTK